jgi:hypothetical protein
MSNLMAQLLREVGRGEREIENARCLLAENSHFEPYSSFIHLCDGTQGFFGLAQLREFLTEQRIAFSDEEMD